MKIFWKHPWTVAACNIAWIMLIYTIMRVFCYYMDRAIFPNIDTAHLIEILLGGMRFDLTAIMYLSSVYVIGMLLPLPASWRENTIYQKVLLWFYWIPNAAGIIVNMADSVYIQFVDRRATCAFFTEVSNDDNMGIVIANGIVEYWYAVLMLIVLLVAFFRLTRRTYSLPRTKAYIYYPVEVALFVVSIYMSVIGIRGGFGS